MAQSLHYGKSHNQKSENYLNISLNDGHLRKIKSLNVDDSGYAIKQTGVIE